MKIQSKTTLGFNFMDKNFIVWTYKKKKTFSCSIENMNSYTILEHEKVIQFHN